MPNLAPRRPYLLRRASTWYLRFRLPSEIQSLVGRTELRLSLHTPSVRVAERRALACHAYLHRLRRIVRLLKLKTLTPEDASRILADLFAEMEEQLERLRREVPVQQELARREWTEQDTEIFGGDYDELSIAHARQECERDIGKYRQELARDNYERVATEARDALGRYGYNWDSLSPATYLFCAGLAKQRITFNEVILARLEGDFRKEEALLSSVRLARPNGAEISPRDVATDVRVSAAWSEFYKEKTASRPNADWSANTAAGQQAMIEEFIEIVGDVPVSQLHRDVIARYLETVSKLPKNRKKRYPNESIESLVALELAAGQRPSARTVKEKMTQLASFLKWCREIWIRSRTRSRVVYGGCSDRSVGKPNWPSTSIARRPRGQVSRKTEGRAPS